MYRNKDDKSTELTLTFTEQEWLLIGVAVSQMLQASNCPEFARKALRPVALHLQQTLNRIWRDSWPTHLLAQGKNPLVTNFAGSQEVDQEYLYGKPN